MSDRFQGEARSPTRGVAAFVVYVIQSISTERLYISQTDDLVRRLAEHNSFNHKPTKYTSRHAGLWRVIYHEAYPSRSEAMHRERWLKSGVRCRRINRLVESPSPTWAVVLLLFVSPYFTKTFFDTKVQNFK